MLPFNPAETLKPDDLIGLLWKRSPSPYLFGLHQRRYVELSGGQLSWSLIEGDSEPGQRRGFVDFCGHGCVVEAVEGSDQKFLLKPTGETWGECGTFTGSNGGNRILQFDATDSGHERDKWIRAIQAHIAYGEHRMDPSAIKKKGKKARGPMKLKFEDEVEEADAASDATSGPKRNIRERVNTGFEFGKPKDDRKLGFAEDHDEVDAATEATDGPKRSVRSRVNTGFERAEDMPKEERKPMQFSEDVEELDAATEATGGPKREVRTRINTGFAKEEDVPKAARKPMMFNDDVEEFDAASEGPTGTKRSVRNRVNTGFERDQPKKERKPMKFSDDVEELDAASEGPQGPKRSVRNRVNTGFETGENAPREPRKPMNFSDDVEELEAASTSPDGPKRSVRQRINTGFANNAEDDDGDEPSGKRGGAIQFGDAHEVDAASEANSGRSRSVRSRVNTGFMPSGNAGDDDDDSDFDDGETPTNKRQSMLQSRLSMERTRRSSRRASVDYSKAHQKREMQHAVVGLGAAVLAEDSPEAQLEKHILEGAEKNAELLKKSLSGLVLFEDVEEQAILDLIEAMRVFAFEDQQEVVRQGDLGGTHFFVVAQGDFEIVKDGNVVATIQAGVTFGESVLLIDGQRMATVRAKGSARVYAMEADDVRDVLRFQYEMEHKEVMAAVDKIIESESCDQIHKKLNAFQLHEFYTNSEVKTFQNGEVIFDQGQQKLDTVYVLVQGAVVLRKDDVDLQRVNKNKMFGIEGFIYGNLEMSAVVDGMAKTLVIGRKVLEDVFGVEKMPTALMKAAVQERLAQVEELSRLHEEQRMALAGAFRVQCVPQGQELDTNGVRLVMALHHDIEVQEATGNKLQLNGINHEYIGKEQLMNPELDWDIQVLSCEDGESWVAVWYIDDVAAAMARDETKDKISTLKMVLLFRTLTQQSIQHLAQNMQTETFERDQAVFKQGEMGNAFYIIGSGRVHIERSGRYIRALGQGDYFGERALLTREPRSASIIANETCIIWKITMETFKEVMPPAMIEYLKGRSTLQDKELSFDDLTFSRVIGTGGFGVVKMVHAKDGSRYALKCVSKKPLAANGQKETLINERSILAEADHPFIVRLVQSFRNEAFVYLLMELVSGGELLEALTHLGILNKTQALFYTGSIIIAFQYLHERRIAYLDLKSENVLIDHQGYIKIVDFGLAVRIRGGQGHAVKGTPHFMAPEMILSRGYDTTADLWSLGICVYEFMVGELPFGNGSTNKSEIFSSVLKAPLVFPDEFRRQPWYEESHSLIKGLLQRIPSKRLGGGFEGYHGIFGHEFFREFDWDALMSRKLSPPYIPKRENYTDGRQNSSGSIGSAEKRPLAQVEKEAEKQELKDGWTDPEPGWDDDFES